MEFIHTHFPEGVNEVVELQPLVQQSEFGDPVTIQLRNQETHSPLKNHCKNSPRNYIIPCIADALI